MPSPSVANVLAPLPAHIAGPHAKLHRHSVAAEKANVALGKYDPDSDQDYSWPNKEDTDALVDLAYVKVFLDNALLRYFVDNVGEDSTIVPVAGYKNRIRSDSVVFASNGDDFPHSDALLDRGARVGDIARVRATVDSVDFDVLTAIKGFVGEVVPDVIEAATADDDNAADQSASTDVSQTAGASNCITVTADGTGYNGLEDGTITETYTIRVTQASTGGDLTSARLRVTSASGLDDVNNVAPADAGSPTDIGTRGLTVTFDIPPSSSSCSSESLEEGVSFNDLLVGQVFVVEVSQAFDAPAATSGGDYDGPSDTTYIVTVQKGGLYADEPTILVTTTTGIDVSGPTIVPAADTAVLIGTFGVTIEFDETGLRKGDKYYVEVVAEIAGNFQTIILKDNLPADMLDAADVTLSLYVKKNIQIPRNRADDPPNVNWSVDQDGLIVEAGLTSFDETWTDADVEQPLDVETGDLFVEYREWLTKFCDTVESMDDPADVAGVLGTVHADNPLAFGVFKALLNSCGTPVHFTAVCNPDDVSVWEDVLSLVAGRTDVYSLVPLTHNLRVQERYAAHAAAQSQEGINRFRVTFVSLLAETTVAVVDSTTSSDETVVLATLSDDPDTAGDNFTLLEVPAGNGKFVTNGVRAGDIVRYLFSTDGFGNDTFEEFVVSEVVNEDTLKLVSGTDADVSPAQKVEIWHNRTRNEIADDLIAQSEHFSSSLVRAVWPDFADEADVLQPGYFLCAALAGARSCLVPHQSLKNHVLLGFDAVTRTTQFLRESQLARMEVAGIWLVTQNAAGDVVTRSAVTTDVSSFIAREEMILANLHSILFTIAQALDPFKGSTNLISSNLAAIKREIFSTLSFLSSNGLTEGVGSQLVDSTVTEVRRHTLFADRLIVRLTLTVPAPFNDVDIVVVLVV